MQTQTESRVPQPAKRSKLERPVSCSIKKEHHGQSFVVHGSPVDPGLNGAPRADGDRSNRRRPPPRSNSLPVMSGQKAASRPKSLILRRSGSNSERYGHLSFFDVQENGLRVRKYHRHGRGSAQRVVKYDSALPGLVWNTNKWWQSCGGQVPLGDILDVERSGSVVWLKCLHLGTVGFEANLPGDSEIFYYAMDALLDLRCSLPLVPTQQVDKTAVLEQEKNDDDTKGTHTASTQAFTFTPALGSPDPPVELTQESDPTPADDVIPANAALEFSPRPQSQQLSTVTPPPTYEDLVESEFSPVTEAGGPNVEKKLVQFSDLSEVMGASVGASALRSKSLPRQRVMPRPRSFSNSPRVSSVAMSKAGMLAVARTKSFSVQPLQVALRESLGSVNEDSYVVVAEDDSDAASDVCHFDESSSSEEEEQVDGSVVESSKEIGLNVEF